MVLKLYGSAMATARVLVVILEKQLPYEHIMVDITKGEHKTESYTKLQPFGKVPVLDDDGLVIYESRAICRYLARKYDTGRNLMPKEGDFEAYAMFEQACSVEQSYFTAATEMIGTELVIRPRSGLGEPDPARIAHGEADLDKVFAIYDEILAKQEYLMGNEVSLVDLFHLPNGAALKAFGFGGHFEKFANVDRWFTSLQKRDTWIEAERVSRMIF